MFSVWGGLGPQTLGEGDHYPRDQKRSALEESLANAARCDRLDRVTLVEGSTADVALL